MIKCTIKVECVYMGNTNIDFKEQSLWFFFFSVVISYNLSSKLKIENYKYVRTSFFFQDD